LIVVEKNHVREQIEGRAIYSLFLNRIFKEGSLIGFLFGSSIEGRYWIVLGASGIGRLQRNVLELHSFLSIRLSVPPTYRRSFLRISVFFRFS
jgi:hypothetical protein